MEEKGCTVESCDENLMILDLETGQLTPVPGPESKSISWVNQLSWSPDGKFLAGTIYNDDHRNGAIALISIDTGAVKTIAEGSNPSWSSKGDWIAYSSTVRCMVIHPDGSGARSVLDQEPKWMTYTIDAPIVWSPDGDKLLLNQSEVAGYHDLALRMRIS
jgi:Tol biopolymer transport system component